MAIGLAFRVIFHSEYGVLNYLISLVGLAPVSWLSDVDYALISLSVGTSYEGSDYIFDPIFPDSYDYRVAVGTAVEEVSAGLKTVDQAVSDAKSSLQ